MLKLDSSHSFDKDSKLTQWSWDHRFREDGLVLEQSSIIPLVVEYARARLPCVIGREWIQLMPFQCRSTTFKPGVCVCPYCKWCVCE